MTFQFENKERLPDFPPRSEFETYRMNQLVQILERRLGALEESILDIDLANSGFVGGDMYAPLSHIHLESEIQDLGDYIDLSFVQNSLILDDISDVAVNSALPGYLLARDPSNTAWVAVAPGAAGGFNPNISGVAQNDILTYNGFEWVNVSQAGAGFVRRSGDIMTGSLQIPEPNSLQLGSAANRLYFDSGANALVLGSNRDLSLTANFIDINSVSGTTTIRGDSVIISHTGVETFRTGVNTVEVWDGDSWEDVVLDTRTLDVIGTANEVVVDLSGPVDLSADRAWTVGLADNPVLPGTGAVTVPTGTTAQEPAGAASLVRYDSDLGTLRFTTGTTWQTPAYSGGAFHDGFSDFVSDEHVAHSGVTVTLTGDTNEIVIGGAAQDIAASLSFTVGIADDAVFPGTGSVTVPVGTTAQEPTPSNGMLRYDSDTGKLRGVEGGAWTDIVGGGGGATDLDSLTDVTLTTPSTGSVLYKSSGDWIDTGAIIIDPVAAVTLYHNGVDTFRTKTDGIQVIGTGTASPVTNPGGVQTGQIQILNANLFPTAYMGHVGSADLAIKNEVHGGRIYLRSDTDAGTLRTLIDADPDGSITLYEAGTIAFQTQSYGASAFGTLFDLDNNLVSTATAMRAYNSVGGWSLGLLATTANMELRQTSSTGTLEDIWISGARNGAVGIYYDGTEKLRTTTTGVEIENTTANAIMKLIDSAGNEGQVVKRSSTGDLRLQNIEDSGWVRLTGSTAASALLDLFIGDPDVGVGFFGSTPIAPPDYTLNTYTTDRNLSSSPTTTELRDVLASLIADLTSYGLLA
jgi:hypothetical protein